MLLDACSSDNGLPLRVLQCLGYLGQSSVVGRQA